MSDIGELDLADLRDALYRRLGPSALAIYTYPVKWVEYVDPKEGESMRYLQVDPEATAGLIHLKVAWNPFGDWGKPASSMIIATELLEDMGKEQMAEYASERLAEALDELILRGKPQRDLPH